MAYIEGEKIIKVAKLIEVLNSLSQDDDLQINALGNILVCADEQEGAYYKGYIDIAAEDFIPEPP